MTLPGTPRPVESSAMTIATTGIFLILLTAALRLGAGLLLPIAIAVLFTMLLDPLVRALRRRRVATSVGAALVVFGTVATVVTGVGLLAGPAADWIETAPRTLAQVQSRVRRMIRPLQETARKVEQAAQGGTKEAAPTVQIKTPDLLQRIGGSTTSFIATTLTVVFLTYFLLATLPAFRAKLAGMIGTASGARGIEEVLTEIEVQMSRYLLLNTLTSVGVGLATWALLSVVGLPNALLWGVAALVLNFIPYAGALVTAVLVGAAALVSFEGTGPVLLAVGGCVAIHLVVGNFITPHLMGRHLPLSPVAIFVSLLYWGWVWGAAGVLLAVPLTVMLQVIFARIDRLRPLAILLDS